MDAFFPVAKLQPTLGQFAGGAELQLIPNGKLFAHEEFPETFVAHAQRFLARVCEPPQVFAQSS